MPPIKITVSRAGVRHHVAPTRARDTGARASGPLRAAFLGRLDPTKGPDLVVKAVRSAPDLKINLDIYGIVEAAAGNGYHRELIAAAAGDPRIVFRHPVPGADVVALLQGYDLVVIPSRWLETGPLVVLEAFAAGTPVIGSGKGGIAELVSHGVDGLLVPTSSVEAWREALVRVDRDRELLASLCHGIRSPRSMVDAADDMMAVYRHVLDNPGEGSHDAKSVHPVHSIH